MNDSKRQANFRQGLIQGGLNRRWKSGSHGWQLVELLPIEGRITKFTGRQVPQPAMLLRQHKGCAALSEPFPVARQNCIAGVGRVAGQMVLADGELGAHRQAHQIVAPE